MSGPPRDLRPDGRAAGRHADRRRAGWSMFETSAVTLGEAGAGPCFARAAREGSICLLDSTCPAILSGLTAAQKGVPFMPLRGLIGSDLLRHRPDWKGHRQSLRGRGSDRPCPCDPSGRLLSSTRLRRIATATFGSVAGASSRSWPMPPAPRSSPWSACAQRSLFDDEVTAAGVLPALYVTAIAEAQRGAAPYGLWGEYAADAAAIAGYARAARTPDGFAAFMRARSDLMPA